MRGGDDFRQYTKRGGLSLYRCMIRAAREAGKPVLLDTSGTLLEECISEAPTLIKPNIDEIRALTGRSMDTRESLIQAAKGASLDGIENVVISLGDGSLVIGKEGVFEVKVPRIDAVNTVGCGDSMIAGFAVGMARGLSLRTPFVWPARFRQPMPCVWRRDFVKEDMEALLPQIQIKKFQN